MKKIFLIILIIIFICFIYNFTKDDKIYYLNIGDGIAKGENYENSNMGYDKTIINSLNKSNVFEKYSNNYISVNYRTTDLITLIKNNVVKNKTSILNDLIKADIITIAIGINDVISYSNNDAELFDKQIFNIVRDFQTLFSLLRDNSKEEIYLIGIYNPNLSNNFNDSLKKLNEILKTKTMEYEIVYIDIFEDMKDIKYLNVKSIYPTQTGYEMIADKVIELLD